MKLDISDIVNRPGGRLERDFELGMRTVDEFEVASAIVGHLYVTNTRKHLLVSGTIDSDLLLPCSRCLEVTPHHIHAIIEEICDLRYLTGELSAQQLRMEEAATALYAGLMLDLDELARQTLIVHIPMQPLCSPHCRGICPQCGANLNYEPCTCEREDIDPRWEKLAALLQHRAGH